jgi:hypothetical protein
MPATPSRSITELGVPTSVRFVWAGWWGPAVVRSTARSRRRSKLLLKRSRNSGTQSSPCAFLHLRYEIPAERCGHYGITSGLSVIRYRS